MEDLQSQLCQMRQALNVANENDRPGLLSIISQLEELITLSGADGDKSSSEVFTNNATPTEPTMPSSSIEDDEFRKFQDEITALENETEKGRSINCVTDEANAYYANGIFSATSPDSSNSKSGDGMDSIIGEVSALEGTKCSAPHQPSWGQLGYYNAIIISVEPGESPQGTTEQKSVLTMDSILVRVVFTQPIVESMLPCPYYQESRCKFADNECKYSHGEILSLSSLKDYKEPNFTQVVPGSRILAKYTDGLWYPATVLNLIDEEIKFCEIKYENSKETNRIPLHDAAPLDFHEEDSSDSDVDFAGDMDEPEMPSNFKVFRGDNFGEWEKYTLGMGSKLMAKMGYIQGGGLGKNGEGRLDPVDVTVYPPGLSLDTCIQIREDSGRKAITVEEKLKRQSRKAENNFIRGQTRHSKGTVFDFLNTNLRINIPESKKSFDISKSSKNVVQINKASSSTLNKSLLSIGENISQVKKKIFKLQEGLQRQSSLDSSIANNLKEKIKNAEKELNEMERREGTLLNERKNRHEKKKLAIF